MYNIILILGLGTYASAMVCLPDACATVRCANVLESDCLTSGGRFVQNGGYCGCCDACRHQLQEGDSCFSTLLLGAPASAECSTGLHCDSKTFKCVRGFPQLLLSRRATGPCATELLSSQGSSLLGAPKPLCDGEGYYQPKQCMGSECYCVAKDGTKITGYKANVWEAQQMTCQCARDQHEYMASGLIGKFFYCTSDGSYQTYQCTGDVCYCADSNGVMMSNSPSVHISEVTKLDCRNGN